MKVIFSKLTILFIVLIISGFAILTLDNPRSFDTSYDSVKNRIITVGTSEDLSNSMKIDFFTMWHVVQDGPNAKCWTELIIQNTQNHTISSTLIYILPKGANVFHPTENEQYEKGVQIEPTDYGTVVYLPFSISGGSGYTALVNFDWPGFAQDSRFQQWEFYVVGQARHPEYIGSDKPFYAISENVGSPRSISFIQEVSLNNTSYRMIDYHPSSAKDYPKLASWSFTERDFDFAINGSYANVQAREWLEPLKQLAFYLPISGFVGLPIEYFRQKSKK
jgi:hypothetical protein